MTLWTPDWKILVNGTELTSVTLTNLTITSGRQDINNPTPPGYCALTIVNFEGTNYNFGVNTAVAIEVKDSSATYIPIFGGRISDLKQTVRSAGSSAIITTLQITAVGSLAKLQRSIFDGNLAQGLDGAQILDLLDDLLLNAWNEIPAAETWANYDATETWNQAGNIGLGEVDAGEYTMVSRQLTDAVIAPIANQIANSALGYLYEDANGLIGYADASHRQDYLVANGYTDLDARQAIASGIGVIQRQGDMANKIIVDYGNNFNSSYTAEDINSQETYGLFAEQINSYVKNAVDVEDVADRLLQLRAYPRDTFQSITFALQSPEIDDTDRDALLNIFMGQPVRITNLPLNILGGEFTGFIEGWTFNASVSGLSVTFLATPTEFSAFAQQWAQVDAAESWNSVLNTLEWQDAIGVIS